MEKGKGFKSQIPTRSKIPKPIVRNQSLKSSDAEKPPANLKLNTDKQIGIIKEKNGLPVLKPPKVLQPKPARKIGSTESKKAIDSRKPQSNIKPQIISKKKAPISKATEVKHPSENIRKIGTTESKKAIDSKKPQTNIKPQIISKKKEPISKATEVKHPSKNVRLGTAKVESNENKKATPFHQQDIEFVADERYRHDILACKELSPNLKTLCNIKNSSIYNRRSTFQGAEFDKAILRLQEQGKRESMLRLQNKMYPGSIPSTQNERQSLFTANKEPFSVRFQNAILKLEENGRRASFLKYKHTAAVSQLAKNNNHPPILKSIENVDLASEKKQTGIEFVADERYRDQILSGKTLSPNLKPVNKLKKSSIFGRQSTLMSAAEFDKKIQKLQEEGKRQSVIRMQNRLNPAPAASSQNERQSIFKSKSKESFAVHLQKSIAKLAEDGKRASLMKIKSTSSVSQLSTNNHHPSILKPVENVVHASENRKASVLKKNPRHIWSPNVDKGSACEIVLKRLHDMQLKQKTESTKKVTFGLEASDSPKLHKPGRKLETYFIDSETRSTSNGNIQHNDDIRQHKDIVRQHDGDATHNHDVKKENLPPTSNNFDQKALSPKALSPKQPTVQIERNVTESHFSAMMLRICGYTPNAKAQITSSDKTSSTSEASADEVFKEPFSPLGKVALAPHSAISQSVGPVFRTYNWSPTSNQPSSELRNSLYSSRTDLRTSQNLSRQELRSSLLSAGSELRNSQSFSRQELRSSLISARSEMRNSIYRSRAILDSGMRRNTLSKLCTPKPVSFHPRAQVANDTSPEFMGRRTSCIVAEAPISTPMVMRNLAESFEDTLSPAALDATSPLCQRLNFDDSEDESTDDVPKESDNSSEVEKRVQDILSKNRDHTLDAECGRIYESNNFSVVFERRLLNPIAQILSQGDDMHFVPLKIR